MNKETANKELQEACNTIFKVENAMPMDSPIRLLGYRARIKIGEYMNTIKQCEDKELWKE